MSPLDPPFRRIAEEEDRLRADGRARKEAGARIAAFRAPPKRRTRAFVALAAAAAVLALVTGAAFELGGPAPLGVELVGAERRPLVGVWLGAPAGASVPLRFSDGTRIELSPSSRARVAEVRPEGARIELERGRLHVEVVPRPGAHWDLVVGPFAVLVTGTRFDVSFDPERDTFVLALEEGSVKISGCAFGAARELAAGQTVRATCQKPSVSVSYEPPSREDERAAEVLSAPAASDRTRPPAAAQDESGPPGDALPPRASPGPAPSAARAPQEWVELARHGGYTEAIAAAEAAGFSAEAKSASLEELVLLGDAARHGGAPRRAVEAFTLLRSRFPGTSDAALAAFTLGCLEFDAFADYQRAAGWFRTYLGEQPGGPVTREALGRLTEALHRAGSENDAREAARRYLKQYPSGPHAELASRLLEAP